MKYVLDASVVFKFYYRKEEKFTENAKKILRDFKEDRVEIYVPQILFYEVGNIFIFKTSVKDALKRFREFIELGLREYEFISKEKIEILKIASTFDITYYDASYYFLAKKINGKLITADEDLIKKIKIKDKKTTIHLKDYK